MYRNEKYGLEIKYFCDSKCRSGESSPIFRDPNFGEDEVVLVTPPPPIGDNYTQADLSMFTEAEVKAYNDSLTGDGPAEPYTAPLNEMRQALATQAVGGQCSVFANCTFISLNGEKALRSIGGWAAGPDTISLFIPRGVDQWIRIDELVGDIHDASLLSPTNLTPELKQRLDAVEEPLKSIRFFTPAAASSVVCYETPAYIVVKRENMSAMKDDVIVKAKSPASGTAPCVFTKEPGDTAVSFDYPTFVWGAAGHYIVLDSGTGPAPRGVSLYDIKTSTTTFDDTRCSNSMTVQGNTILYSVCTDEAVTQTNCPNRADIESMGLAPTITAPVALDVGTLTKREVGPRECTAMQ